jgi:hypothetical protein
VVAYFQQPGRNVLVREQVLDLSLGIAFKQRRCFAIGTFKTSESLFSARSCNTHPRGGAST